jgi:hypothetical protein
VAYVSSATVRTRRREIREAIDIEGIRA